MAKQFKQAPLPFVGQKRMFLKHFEHILNGIIGKYLMKSTELRLMHQQVITVSMRII